MGLGDGVRQSCDLQEGDFVIYLGEFNKMRERRGEVVKITEKIGKWENLIFVYDVLFSCGSKIRGRTREELILTGISVVAETHGKRKRDDEGFVHTDRGMKSYSI